MPVVRVPLSFPEFEDAVAEIEKTSRILSISTHGDGAALIVTEPRRQPARETRGGK